MRVARGPARRSPTERFWEKVERPASADGCWLWTSALDDGGYGVLWVDGTRRAAAAHRFAYELIVGAIPEGMTLDHLCRVKRCVNPAHLEPCTPQDNVRRAQPYSTFAAQTHCKRGHEFTEANTYRHHGRRECRACNALREREKRRRRLVEPSRSS